MNKLDFLRRLDRELSPLDKTERRELLAFYEERFYNGTIYENKTEEQVVAELESPEVIARNILSEYGISVKEAKSYNAPRIPLPGNYKRRNEKHKQTNQEPYNNDNYNSNYNSNNNAVNNQEAKRNDNQEYDNSRTRRISTSKLIWLLIIDVFVLSWAIPSIFSVVVSLAGSLASYIGVLGFLASDVVYDQMIFWFLTGAYILLFSFTLVVLEFFIWTVKKTIIWHMKVLRYKKVNDWNKKLSRFSVEGWFKRHKLLKFIKNISGVAAIVVMTYTGFYLWAHYDDINELYIQQEVLTDVQKFDVTDDIADLELWDIYADIDSMNIEVIPTIGNEIIITRTYREDSEADYDVVFDVADNQAAIIHDLPNTVFNFKLSIKDIFAFLQEDELTIEVPMELLLGDVTISNTNGTVDLYNLTVDELYVDGSNGKIELNSMTINGDAIIKSSNAVMEVKDSIGTGELVVLTSNGKIIIRDSAFIDYDLRTSNGRIILENLNVESKNGNDLYAKSSNGSLDFTDVYVAKVDANTSNGDIDYVNTDLNFDVDFESSTSNGQTRSTIN